LHEHTVALDSKAGEILLDACGQENSKLKLNDLLNKFFAISIEVGNAI